MNQENQNQKESPSMKTTGIVEGVVQDPNGLGVLGAEVSISQDGSVKFQQITQEQGAYRIENVPPGDYDIQAFAPQGISKKGSATVVAGKTFFKELRVKPPHK